MWCGVSAINQKESDTNATLALPVAGVDLAKSVFQLAVVDGSLTQTRKSPENPGRFSAKQKRATKTCCKSLPGRSCRVAA
jgi:hypothetical protein